MNTIKIGSQEWATEDLKVNKFRNGEDIPLVSEYELFELGTAAYCITDNGHHLYNWYAVSDPRGLSPEGFRIPSDEEWTELIDAIGGEEVAGRKMKTKKWGGDNSSGFSALPGSLRYDDNGCSYYADDYGIWWSSSAYGSDYAWSFSLYFVSANVYRDYSSRRDAFYVRCVRDAQ